MVATTAPAPSRSPSSQPTRCTLLATAALVAPASLLPTIAVAAAAEPDPHVARFAEWRLLVDWCNSPHADGEDDLRDDPHWCRALELERLAAGTPARTVAGAAAQVRLACAFMETYGSLGDGVNDGTLLASALATLARLAGEARHV
jgi:hypothetical protein